MERMSKPASKHSMMSSVPSGSVGGSLGSGSPDDSVPPPLPTPRVKEVTGVSLSNLMDTSKNGYPIVTSITTGSYGLRSESLLYHQDVLIHFEMRVKVIESLFEKGGSYMVPVCSANKFSVLFNPSENMGQAMMGNYYETVGHILAKQHKPKVICATRSFKSASGGAVQDGEILIIQKIQRRHIKCLNTLTNEEKKLHESCAGAFTTQPERIKLSLRDISRNIDLPLKVIMYHQLPHVVLSNHVVVTLLKEKWEESVVASRNTKEQALKLIRFTKDIGINFIPQPEDKIDEVEQYSRCRETCRVFKEFNYSKIHVHLFHEDPVWPNHEEIQSAMYSHVVEASVQDTTELRRPEKAFKISGRQPSVILEPPQPKLDPMLDVESPIPDAATILHTVNTVNRQMMIAVESLRAEVEGLKMELRQTKNLMSSIKRELPSTVSEAVKYELQRQQTQHIIEQSHKEDVSNSESIINLENVEILKGFTHEQLLQTLEKLSLKRCIPILKRKGLSGADLAQYDTKSKLETEFGLNSKLDVLRLSKLIRGCPTVWNLLESSNDS